MDNIKQVWLDFVDTVKASAKEIAEPLREFGKSAYDSLVNLLKSFWVIIRGFLRVIIKALGKAIILTVKDLMVYLYLFIVKSIKKVFDWIINLFKR